ncbi:MAG: phosphoribosyltransferase [Chloroflexi bacterium]|nr:phosphoribosyltransferase [Chloroflexota bacterium]MCL5108136.1 phosphoribosyltransferase [Chloroflexota bacterium]
MIFADRREAGQRLARALPGYRGSDAVVLALPRGGVIVGCEVARTLSLPLDVIITRKVGAPGNPEYAIGAISEAGEPQLNEREIAYMGIPASYVAEEVELQRRELERRAMQYRGGRELGDISGRTVILVDDGIATGFTVLATVRALKTHRPARIVLAVPVAPPSVVETLGREVDDVVALATPEPFIAVGAWYRHFEQVSDEEVRACLDDCRQQPRNVE